MARLRLRLPGAERADGNVQRGLRDYPPDVERGLSDLQGEVLHDRPADQRAEGRPEATPSSVDRWVRRADHAQTRRAVRGRLQYRAQPRGCPAQARGAP